jgi:hypothetical protein
MGKQERKRKTSIPGLLPTRRSGVCLRCWHFAALIVFYIVRVLVCANIILEYQSTKSL